MPAWLWASACLTSSAEAGLEGLAWAGLLVDVHGGLGVAFFDEIPVVDALPAAAEGAVADHFGVEAAVVGVVDLLGHEAVEGGADFGDGLVGVNGEDRGLGEGGSGEGGGEERRTSKRFLLH